MLRHAWVAIAAFMLMAGASGAAPSDDAFAAYQKGDYKTALTLMRPLAEKGDVKAQYNLGAMYAIPSAFPRITRRRPSGLRWPPTRATSLPLSISRSFIKTAKALPRLQEGDELFRLGAEKKSSTAEASIAAMYERGLGVTQDYKEAAKWFRLAADHGNATAQYNVASCMPMDAACRGLEGRRRNGIARRPIRASTARS